MIQRLSIIPAVLALLLPVMYFVYRGWFMFAGAGVALVFLLLLVRRLDSWWTAAIATMGSGLYVAQVTPALKLHDFIVLGFAGLSIVTLIITKHHAPKSSAPRVASFALLAILLATAFWRGWGLQLLGSSMWGGMQYVILVSALLFYIYSAHVTVPGDRMWRTIIVFFVLALLPAAAFLLIHFAGINALGNFVAVGETDIISPETTVGRWQILEKPAIFAGLFAILLYDRKFRVTVPVLVLAAGSFVMIGLSGHRTSAVMLGLMGMTYLAIRWRFIPLSQRYLLFIGGLIMVGALYAFIPRMPLSFQRALAWVPGLEISFDARMSALTTSNWRIDMWKQMLPMIPDYLWMGRGLAFDLSEAYSAFIMHSDYTSRHLFFIAVHNYHNGPLWLLMDLGLAGFVSGLVFTIGGMILFGRRIRHITAGAKMKTAYVVFYSYFVARCIFFFAVIGGGQGLAELLVVAGIMEVIYRSGMSASVSGQASLGDALKSVTTEASGVAVPLPGRAAVTPWPYSR